MNNKYPKHILFIGPSPSKKNADIHIPFSGTNSAKVLMNWIHEMNLWQYQLYFYNIRNRVNTNFFSINEKNKLYMRLQAHLSHFNWRIISLGNLVSDELTNYSKVKNFKLPHPSGRNRQLNNKEFIKNQLKLCKEYIND